MKNPRLKDMTGFTFGSWSVTHQTGNNSRGMALWNCICECGNVKSVTGADLRAGKSKSCGCVSSKAIGERSKTHGKTGSRLYSTWQNMKRRCQDLEDPSYGGKGITVCEAWLKFENFSAWAEASGYTDQLTIERKDNSLGYNPENCTWIPKSRQALNRTIVRITPEGQAWSEVARNNGIPAHVFNNRVWAGGWSYERAATQPLIENGKRKMPQRGEDGQFLKGAGKLWKRHS